MGKEIIVAKGLSKTYGTGWPWKKIRALEDLDLSVREGEIFGYLGPNGSGKTTTLKLIVGLLRPTRGSVVIGGMAPSHPQARRIVGFLPENPYFYEYLTGREFLSLCARLGKDHPSRGKVREIIGRVGLQRAADLPLRKYSKGMLQRVGLAQAMVADPQILILDEPLSGLDPIGRREIRDLIHELRGEGKTIFFSSHILADAELICDRVAFIDHGRLIVVGSLKELLSAGGGKVEIRLAGLREEEIGRLSEEAEKKISGKEETIFILPSEEKMPPFIAMAEKLGGRLVSVTPRRESLEDLFLRLVKEGGE